MFFFNFQELILISFSYQKLLVVPLKDVENLIFRIKSNRNSLFEICSDSSPFTKILIFVLFSKSYTSHPQVKQKHNENILKHSVYNNNNEIIRRHNLLKLSISQLVEEDNNNRSTLNL